MTTHKNTSAQASLSSEIPAPFDGQSTSLSQEEMRQHIAEGRRLQSQAFHALLQTAFKTLWGQSKADKNAGSGLLNGQPIRSSVA